MTTLLDTNIVIALGKPSDAFHPWAVEQLETAKRESPPAVICDTSFAEASVSYGSAEELAVLLAEWGIDRLPTSDEALYLAGQAYKAYRTRGGKRDGALPDFIIGAVAQVEGVPLVTANPKDFTRFFTLTLIEPSQEREAEAPTL